MELLKSFFSKFNSNLSYYLNITIGILTVIFFAASMVMFFSYLYQPVFAPVKPTFSKVSVNVELLNTIKAKIKANEEDLNKKIQTTYSDPFSPPLSPTPLTGTQTPANSKSYTAKEKSI